MTEFVQTLSSTIGIPIFDLVRTKPGHNGGTMVHRRVAMYLAQRISPLFNVQVTGYLDELLLTGRVELGKEKTSEQLDAIFNRRIVEEQAKIQADYLREKLSKDLLAIDEDIVAKRAKRQRDDAAAEEERVAKRKRDDAAFEEEMRVRKIKIICVILRFLNVTGACIYFKNKNGGDSDERFSTNVSARNGTSDGNNKPIERIGCICFKKVQGS